MSVVHLPCSIGGMVSSSNTWVLLMLKRQGLLNRDVAWRITYHPILSIQRGLLTVAIESSCDDTCVAILELNDHPSSNKRDSLASVHFHERITADNHENRGIDPLKALDSHRQNLALLVSKSLQSLPAASDGPARRQKRHSSLRHGCPKRLPDFVTVTRGPGMRSNLSCGLDTAKGLAVAWQVPLLAVHHMQAHALTPRLVHALGPHCSLSNLRPKFPFLSLLVSGGHSMLIHSKSLTEHKTLATTRNIAVGEALDKIGRLVLPGTVFAGIKDMAYAKHLSTYAYPSPTDYATYRAPATRGEEHISSPNAFGWQISTPFADTRQLSFSFSSIASEVQRIFGTRTSTNPELTEEERLTFARSALTVSFNHLASRTVIALEKLEREQEPINTLVVSGGVAANPFLRHVLRQFLDIRGFAAIELRFPPADLCTDNAAMIAWCGMEMFDAGWRSELSCRAIRRWSMDPDEGGGGDDGQPGGVLGVDGWYNVGDDAKHRGGDM